MKNDFVKSFALSVLIVSFSVLLVIVAVIVFAIFAAQKFGQFLQSIPLSYTITYGVIAAVLTYIRRKYK